MKKTYTIKRKLGVLRSRIRDSYVRVVRNARERIFGVILRVLEQFWEDHWEDGSIGGEIAGLILLLMVVAAIVGILSYMHISLSEIEQWFRNVGFVITRGGIFE